ncbi:MAG: glycerate dehydrogenase [Betaproteobacteria bacterium TMED82]|nr:MAG: glycerate dehydrogenase [Betaproteobacteria bacterium TMED82]|tara:strand:+ start:8529 stop:9476 length:948 start_codon:yes stop_codon:yes gene_type:complete
MEKVVFLDRESLNAKVRRPEFQHDWVEYDQTSPNEIINRLAEASIAITNKVPIRKETIAKLPKLRFIAVAATGYDVIDIGACKESGISVSNIRNYAVNTVPEHTFSLILALKRNLFAYRRDVLAGRWQKHNQFCFFDYQIGDLRDSTIGIFGEGALGQGTARIAEGFGMKVLFADHPPPKSEGINFTDPEEVFAKSDIISLHCPLTENSRGFIGLDQFKLMKKTSILINTARGGLVKEADLVEALEQKMIAGAGFDVLTKEPPLDGNPLLDLDLPNFILTPHVAWASDEAQQFLADQLIDNVDLFFKGNPQNLVG